jgi:valacyclovir hydrolase
MPMFTWNDHSLFYRERGQGPLLVIADSCVQHFTEAMLRDNIAPGQVAFWEYAHGEDWAQVVDADTNLIRRFVARGGTWAEGRLAAIEAPVLFTASARDTMLPAVRTELAAMSAQISDSRVYLHAEGDHPLMWTQPTVFRYQADFFLESIEN